MNKHLEYILAYLRFSIHWAIKYLWALIVPFYLIKVLFPGSFWWLWLTLWVSLSYNAFLTAKKKGILYLFKLPAFVGQNRKIIFKLVVLVEVIFIVVACYILSKGLQTITGVQEKIFSIPLLGLSITMAVGISLFMFWLLYVIGNVYDRKFIIGYIILDAIILMPFNFMFIYEKNQSENLVKFHGREIPVLFDKLNISYSVKQSNASKNTMRAQGKNKSIDSAITILTKDKQYMSNGAEQAVKEERSPAFYNNELARINKQLKRLRNSGDTLVSEKESLKRNYDTIVTDLSKLRPARDSISKTYNDESYSRNVSLAKDQILNIAARDSTILYDSAVARSLSVLQVKPEVPTDAFIHLCKEIVSLPRKLIGKSSEQDSLVVITPTPEQRWKIKLRELRWSSFIPSILIDIIPLVAAIFAGGLRRKFD